MAVLAPIASASMATEVALRAGLFRRVRNAKRRSCTMLLSGKATDMPIRRRPNLRNPGAPMFAPGNRGPKNGHPAWMPLRHGGFHQSLPLRLHNRAFAVTQPVIVSALMRPHRPSRRPTLPGVDEIPPQSPYAPWPAAAHGPGSWPTRDEVPRYANPGGDIGRIELDEIRRSHDRTRMGLLLLVVAVAGAGAWLVLKDRLGLTGSSTRADSARSSPAAIGPERSSVASAPTVPPVAPRPAVVPLDDASTLTE